MVKKCFYIACLFLLNKDCFGLIPKIDSSRVHFFELGYFASPTLRSGIYKTDQYAIQLKLGLSAFQYKKLSISINPNFTFLTNKMYRGNFIVRPAEIAFTEIKLRANSFGVSLGAEYSVNSKIKIKAEFGLSSTSYSLFSRRDRIKDTVTCAQNDSSSYFSLCDFLENKKGQFASLNVSYKLNERLSLSVGYLYRKTNYVLRNYTYYNTCGFVQEAQGAMSVRSGNIFVGLRYNFSLKKFK